MCVCVCVCVCTCPSTHCPWVITGVHMWVCPHAGTSWCLTAVHIAITECLLYTQHCVLYQVALAPASGSDGLGTEPDSKQINEQKLKAAPEGGEGCARRTLGGGGGGRTLAHGSELSHLLLAWSLATCLHWTFSSRRWGCLSALFTAVSPVPGRRLARDTRSVVNSTQSEVCG